MYLKLKAFRAVNDLDTCLKFANGHQNVLKDYGITNITTNTDSWMHHPETYCIVAESEDEVVGGVRIQLSGEKVRLPVEMAVGRMDGNIYKVVEQMKNHGGIGELCALWNARRVAGAGISLLLVRAGVAVATQLRINSMISICADYTLKMFQRAGFVVDTSLGEEGVFPYPNNTYMARVLSIQNTATLPGADAYDRGRIVSLRSHPMQEFVEAGVGQDIHVSYQLLIDNH